MTNAYGDALDLCDICHERPRGRHREVIGWEQLREQGGQNAVIGRKETGRWACDICIYKIRNNIDPLNQTELF